MSLRDEIAQVLHEHGPDAAATVWPNLEYRCRACRTWHDDQAFAAHQADAVIAHLALTEETHMHLCDMGCRTVGGPPCPGSFTNQRRYVTPWEDA